MRQLKGRLNNIVSKKVKGISIPKTDKRGKHANRPNKVSEEKKPGVRNHINLIPKYQSNYSRTENLHKEYLNCGMTISSLYSDYYLPWCIQQNIEPVLEHT